jgi:hypothetical protein
MFQLVSEELSLTCNATFQVFLLQFLFTNENTPLLASDDIQFGHNLPNAVRISNHAATKT